MRIVITGALGHIGSKLIRTLPNCFPNAEIVMIDSLLTQRYCSLFNLPVNHAYSFIEGDVTKIDLVPVLNGADFVIHLAAITNAENSFNHPGEVEENNFNATSKIANACIITKSKLITISSTSVYGSQKKVVDETCIGDDLKPQSPYATTKINEESLIQNMCSENDLKAVICRFGTIYGASNGMRFHTAINKFCWQATMGTDITVWKTAYEQVRPYLDLNDAATAISFIIKNDIFNGEIYNILSQNLTVKEVLSSISEFIPNLKISFVDSPIMNQLSYHVLSEKFSSLGFKFEGNLRQGIGETLSLLKNSNIFYHS